MVMLQQKGVEVESRCPVYKREPEIIDHVFLHCSVAIQCWQIVIPNVQCTRVTLMQWWECVLKTCDNHKKAEQYLEQWRYAQSKVSYSLFPQAVEGDGGDSWVRPQELAIKVSVDASIFREINASGIGLVARDSKGEIVMARTVGVNEVLDPNMGEIMAIKEALNWTKNTTWQNITVESDCLVAVQAVRSKLARALYSSPDRYLNRSSVPIVVGVALEADLC
ncbi:uncharacterized protein LOC141700315 [Apium graveolens]|uniref:uncharacterized protein LOC141700315 n=1 Tax=Apium graveolens TaxID=4045 RepID=UPI003D7B87EE